MVYSWDSRCEGNVFYSYFVTTNWMFIYVICTVYMRCLFSFHTLVLFMYYVVGVEFLIFHSAFWLLECLFTGLSVREIVCISE